MKKLLIPAIALMFGVAAQAETGFHVGAQVGSAEPQVSDRAAAFAFTTGPTGTTAATVSQPFDRHVPIAVNFGYKSGVSDFVATVFSTSKTSNDSIRDSSGNLQFAVGSVTGLDLETKLKALIVDLDWRRTLVQTDSMIARWSAGLRFGSVESQINTRSYDSPGFTPIFDFKVKGESELVGITAGLDSTTMLTSNLYFSAALKLGLVDGKLERTVDIYDLTPPTNGGLSLHYAGEHRSLLQTEAGIKLGMKFFKGFDAYLGYEYRDFDEDSAHAGGMDAVVAIGTFLPQTKGFGLSGFILGANYAF